MKFYHHKNFELDKCFSTIRQIHRRQVFLRSKFNQYYEASVLPAHRKPYLFAIEAIRRVKTIKKNTPLADKKKKQMCCHDVACGRPSATRVRQGGTG